MRMVALATAGARVSATYTRKGHSCTLTIYNVWLSQDDLWYMDNKIKGCKARKCRVVAIVEGSRGDDLDGTDVAIEKLNMDT